MITSATSRRLRITLWRVIGLVFLLLILLFVFARIHVRRDIHRQLAEIRQSGGLMTLMDLQAQYQDIDGRHNGAFDLIAVASHLNGIEEELRREGRTNDAFYELPFLPKGEPPPKGARLDPALLDSIAEALGRTGDAFDQLHGILARTNQAYVHTMNLSLGLSAPMTHLSPLKTTSRWLALKAVHGSSTQKPDEAVVALLDGLQLARSLEREPILISQLVRLSMLRISIRSLEWVLDQAELAPDQLTRLPGGLPDLVPDYLPAAPLDPRTGQPLTLVPSSNGYTILGKDALFTIDRPAGE
jgi:hypothetical protein